MVLLFRMNDVGINHLYNHLLPSAWQNFGLWNILSNSWCERKINLNTPLIINNNACYNCINM